MSEPRRVVVTGAAALSPVGGSPAALHAALCRGEAGVGPVAAFDAGDLPCRSAAEVRDLDPARYLGEANFRPLDRTGLLAVVAAKLALAAGGWGAWNDEERAARELGLALGTTFGSVHTISEFDRRALTAGPNYVKPFDFANSVINAAAGQTAIWHRLTGVNSTISGGPTAGLEALAYAAGLVAGGRSEAILAGGADELCFESFCGFARAGLLCGNGRGEGDEERPIPFDAGRNGFALGEGAALLALESESAAAGRGAAVLAELRGWGSAFDPSRGRDEAAAAAAVERAVRAALAAAAVTPGEVDCVVTSASGSVAGDRREAAGVAAALGPEVAAELPATAIKATVGEGLGAGGALLAVTLLETMRTGLLPGIRGLAAAEPGLALPSVAAATRSVAVEIGLVTALDFDGAAAALVFARRNGSTR